MKWFKWCKSSVFGHYFAGALSEIVMPGVGAWPLATLTVTSLHGTERRGNSGIAERR